MPQGWKEDKDPLIGKALIHQKVALKSNIKDISKSSINPKSVTLIDWLDHEEIKIKYLYKFEFDNVTYFIGSDRWKLEDKEAGQWIIYPVNKNQILGEIKISHPNSEGSSYLYNMNIETKGKGIGTNVWKIAEKFLIKTGTKVIHGYVEYSNGIAYNFWTKQGFVIEKETKHGWKIMKNINKQRV